MNPSVKLINLKNGGTTIVDEEDYARLARLNWHLHKTGYACYNYRRRKLHRQIHLKLHRLVAKAKSGEVVHHVNCNKLDNRKSNLIKITAIEHLLLHGVENRIRKDNSSGHPGVRYETDTSKWRAGITRRKRKYYLGRFATFEEALSARLQAERLLDGDPSSSGGISA